MKKLIPYGFILSLCACLLFHPLPVHADAVEGDYFLSLGADLTGQEKDKVFELLGISEEDARMSREIEVTNEEEHQYLDSYITPKAIGSRALSSVYIEKKQEGYGIDIETKNITFCTEQMYKSALTTAGLTDVRVVIAGPYEISGTAALVGTMKAYENMTGEEISEETKDAVNNELITTKELSESIGEEEATEFISTLKKKAAEEDISSSEDLEALVEETCEEQGITLTDEERESVEKLIRKFDDLDIDINTVMKQASDIYKNLNEQVKEKGIGDQIKAFFQRILDMFR